MLRIWYVFYILVHSHLHKSDFKCSRLPYSPWLPYRTPQHWWLDTWNKWWDRMWKIVTYLSFYICLPWETLFDVVGFWGYQFSVSVAPLQSTAVGFAWLVHPHCPSGLTCVLIKLRMPHANVCLYFVLSFCPKIQHIARCYIK